MARVYIILSFLIFLASCSGNSNNTNIAGFDSISKHSSQVYVPAKIFHITGDVLTYLGRTNNGSISVAYGWIRINISGKKKTETKN